jgi:predicted permease
VPVFIVIGAGYLAKCFGIIRESDVPRMNAVAFRVFMLAMCFYNVYNSELSSAFRPKLILFAVVGVAVLYACLNLYVIFGGVSRYAHDVFAVGKA